MVIFSVQPYFNQTRRITKEKRGSAGDAIITSLNIEQFVVNIRFRTYMIFTDKLLVPKNIFILHNSVC